MSSVTRVGAYLVLCRLLQMVFDLSNRQFLLILLIGTVVIFIITSVTHTHDIPADEVMQKAADKVETALEKTHTKDQEHPLDEQDHDMRQGTSGHTPPKGI